MIEDQIAKRLYDDWRASDRELQVSWEDAPDNLREVFLRYARTSLKVTAYVWDTEPHTVEQKLREYLRIEG